MKICSLELVIVSVLAISVCKFSCTYTFKGRIVLLFLIYAYLFVHIIQLIIPKIHTIISNNVLFLTSVINLKLSPN